MQTVSVRTNAAYTGVGVSPSKRPDHPLSIRSQHMLVCLPLFDIGLAGLILFKHLGHNGLSIVNCLNKVVRITQLELAMQWD